MEESEIVIMQIIDALILPDGTTVNPIEGIPDVIFVHPSNGPFKTVNLYAGLHLDLKGIHITFGLPNQKEKTTSGNS